MSLDIDTDDVATFSGKQVVLEVVPQQDLVDQARSLLIKIDFEIDVSDTYAKKTESAISEDHKNQFGFDQEQLVVPAITCSKVDRLWLIKLPEVLGDELGSVTLQLEEEQKDVFSLDTQNVIRMTEAGLEVFIKQGQCNKS